MSKNRLTAKQRCFVEVYAGNATEAAIAAGYSPKTAYSIGQNNLKKVEIQKAIQARETERMGKAIATREQRQQFWTEVMESEEQPMRDRLKASELLGKSEGDFLDRVEAAIQPPIQPPLSPREVMEEIRRQMREGKE